MYQSDVIIVGGGCTGTSTAFHLARKGLKVTLLEKNSLGDGQTGHSSATLSTGVLSRNPRPLVQYNAAAWSLDFFRNFLQEVGLDAFYVETGWLSILTSQYEKYLDEYLATLKSLSIRVKVITKKEASELIPGIQLNESEACIFDEDAGYADPMATIHGFAAGAQKFGAKVLEKSEVRKIKCDDNNRIVGVETGDGKFEAPNLLLATGAWTNELLNALNVQIPVFPLRTEIGIIRKPTEIIGTSPIAIDYQNKIYWRPEGKDRFHVGFLHASVNIPEAEKQDFSSSRSPTPDNFDRGNSFRAIEDLSNQMVNRIPAMSRGDWKGGYACVYDMTTDGLPIIDKIGNYTGLYVACGFSGGGFHTSPWIGKEMAEFILKGERPAELLPYSAERFSARNLADV